MTICYVGGQPYSESGTSYGETGVMERITCMTRRSGRWRQC